MATSIGFLPSAARSSAGQSDAVDATGVEFVSLMVHVTAAGTTMTPSLEWSNNGTDWATADPADAFTAITATGRKVKTFQTRARFFRLAWTITGSFTFSADVFWRVGSVRDGHG